MKGKKYCLIRIWCKDMKKLRYQHNSLSRIWKILVNMTSTVLSRSYKLKMDSLSIVKTISELRLNDIEVN